MLKSSAVLFSVLAFFGIKTAYADADMFRIIENFEKNEIKKSKILHRSPFVYRPIDPAQWGQVLGDCNPSCKNLAAKFKTPIKNGCPVVSEDEF